MDPRRLLILAGCGLLLSGCAAFRGLTPNLDGPVVVSPTSVNPAVADPAAGPPAEEVLPPVVTVDVNPPDTVGTASQGPASPTERPYRARADAPGPASGDAILDDHRMGAVQVFAWSPGRVFTVRATPLRVTTLSLPPGETLLGKAAGDTVRWHIGEVRSGLRQDLEQTHVVLKPLTRGLETNLILTTNRRVYLIDLKSGGADGFDPAVSWTPEPGAMTREPAAETQVTRVALPEGELDARYRIEPQGRRAAWTPTAVFSDGLRTFITFDPDMQAAEAPALFSVTPDGERRLVNYRQVGGLYVVDRVLDRAELRLGDRRPQVVTIRRIGEGRT